MTDAQYRDLSIFQDVLKGGTILGDHERADVIIFVKPTQQLTQPVGVYLPTHIGHLITRTGDVPRVSG